MRQVGKDRHQSLTAPAKTSGFLGQGCPAEDLITVPEQVAVLIL